MEEKITVHEKPRGETVSVYVGEYKGTKYLHIREWYLDTNDKQEKPTKKGVALPIEKVEALKEAIDHLVSEPSEERVTVHEKSRGETVSVYVGEYRGTKYLHIREWYLDNNDKQEKPTKKGVALPMEKIEALKEALNHLTSK